MQLGPAEFVTKIQEYAHPGPQYNALRHPNHTSFMKEFSEPKDNLMQKSNLNDMTIMNCDMSGFAPYLLL